MKLSNHSFDSKSFISQLTTQPGVYRMIGEGDELLYVGKARNLKKRVAQYFLRTRSKTTAHASGDPRIEAMVGRIRRIEVTVTPTEDQALLLEATLIKQSAPRYNISLRDDKSYPYLRIATDHPYPRIAFHRGATRGPDRYFGPYPSAQAVRETLLSLQKLFRLRPCSDPFFANRKRPCLQYQIKRCSAPCVRLISAQDYARDLANAARLLEGRGDELAGELGEQMEEASRALAFERAARLRDQIAALRRIQDGRAIARGARNLDVVACAPHPSSSCIVVMTLRDGLNLGHRSYFPLHPENVELPDLLSGFLAQYYLERPIPPEILVPALPADAEWLEQSLAGRVGRRVRIAQAVRGARAKLMKMAQATASQALSAHLAVSATMRERLADLQRVLDLEQPPQRLECFDISHTGGERAVASCVVFDAEGPQKSSYRKFNIEGITPGDDYAAVAQAVGRRYARVKSGEAPAPDVLFIDGGKGQLRAALEALEELQYPELKVVAIAKGPGRRPGFEQLFVAGAERPIRLPPDSPGLHLIQRIRDEAHRFAITGHRGRREKARLTSELERIEGLGPVRRRALLRTLGGIGQIKRAGADDLAKVQGISRKMAERIYAHFH